MAKWIANLIWARPVYREVWHPLTEQEQRDARAFRRRTRTAPPGGRRTRPLTLRWWLGLDPDGSKRIRFDLRIVTRERLAELRSKAVERGYDGRAWRTGEEYAINESAMVWVNAGLRLRDGVVICDLMVSQWEFESGSRGEQIPWPRNLTVRRHRLDIHNSDWRRLRRASESDMRDIYFRLQTALPFDSNEVEPWDSP